ncbi:hypothetical protein MSAN_01605400 [Mycena sanguinolenta]|uniref:DUF6533 domain-containing protein n=1 Tax=Mycena sanguinolenta TaxID=230812 RepID=A0A8H6Y305_9AGAR|nr:hypothetical protein MSAN_01605400 [Mycena sanguinolenta]
MSDPILGDSSGLDYVTFASDHRIYCSFFLAGLTILLYDHILTLGMEVKYIWSSKLRPATCWFLAVRCVGLSASITMSVFYFGHMGQEVCVKMQLAWEVLLVIQEILIECTLGLRVLAVYGLNLWILTGLLGAGGVAASLALVSDITDCPILVSPSFEWAAVKYGHPQMLSAPGLAGCHTAIPRTSALRLAGAWEAQLVCDTLVFALTVRCAYIQRRMSLRYRGTLVERMVTDGGMYFGIIVLANLANLLTFYVGDVLLSGLLSWFTTSLSVTLLSRLMLNLHEAANVGIDTAEPNTMELESIGFQTVPTTIDARC